MNEQNPDQIIASFVKRKRVTSIRSCFDFVITFDFGFCLNFKLKRPFLLLFFGRKIAFKFVQVIKHLSTVTINVVETINWQKRNGRMYVRI